MGLQGPLRDIFTFIQADLLNNYLYEIYASKVNLKLVSCKIPTESKIAHLLNYAQHDAVKTPF
jgi:hypothetical protein